MHQSSSPPRSTMALFATASFLLVAAAHAYDNGAPNARLPTLGWSSWVGLGPAASNPVFDFCDEFSIRAAVDAFVEVGLYDAGCVCAGDGGGRVTRTRPHAPERHPHADHEGMRADHRRAPDGVPLAA